MKPPVRMGHAVLLGCWVLAGCEEPTMDDVGPPTCIEPGLTPSKAPDIPVTYTNENLDIHVEDGGFLCAGTAKDLDLFVSYVADELGIVSDRRIPVYILNSTSGWCQAGAIGCSKRDGTALAGSPSILHHEIVHSVACEVRFESPATLVEGLAVSFEPFPNSAHGMPSEFADLPRGPGFSYDEAGHFVRWRVIRAVCSSLSPATSPSTSSPTPGSGASTCCASTGPPSTLG